MKFDFWVTVKTAFTFAVVFQLFSLLMKLTELVVMLVYGGK